MCLQEPAMMPVKQERAAAKCLSITLSVCTGHQEVLACFCVLAPNLACQARLQGHNNSNKRQQRGEGVQQVRAGGEAEEDRKGDRRGYEGQQRRQKGMQERAGRAERRQQRAAWVRPECAAPQWHPGACPGFSQGCCPSTKGPEGPPLLTALPLGPCRFASLTALNQVSFNTVSASKPTAYAGVYFTTAA